MQRKFIDITGQKFGRLTAIKMIYKPDNIKWFCICECGNTKITKSRLLREGKTKSCGCLKGERKPIEVNCSYCGKLFIAPFYRKKDKKMFFCPNTNHYALWRSKNLVGKNSPLYGIKRTEEFKKKIAIIVTGSKHTEETKRKMSFAHMGEKSHRYIGGSSYDHYAPLLFDEKTRRDPAKPKAIQVRCKLDACKKWFTPDAQQCGHRLKGVDSGISYFYCSDACKDACSVFGRVIYFKGMMPSKKRKKIMDYAFREMVLEEDNYQCIRCESTGKLKVHHTEGVTLNPMTANDIDSGVTFCGNCHDWIHSQPGCSFSDHRLKVCST